ncbi:MAG: 4-alpha-glucanotransferase, partial [Phycisphaerae bacterium]
MTDRPHLKTLADRVGILPSYVDISGVEHVTPDATRVAFLEAMGLGASTEAAAERTVEALAREQAASLMPRVRVVTVGEGPLTIPLWLPEDASGEVEWSAEVSAESGEQPGRRLKKGTGTSPAATNDSVDGWLVGAGPHFQVSASGSVHVANGAGPAEVRIDRRLPEGYHTLRVAVELPGRVVEAEQSLIVSPGRCTPLATLVGERQALGLWTNLYALRSDRNMGVGDLTDLKQLFEFAGEHNAEFVGINPLHALYNRGEQISPYCPVSRLYRNVLYLDVEAVPELPECREAKRLVASTTFQRQLGRLRSSRQVEYDNVLDLKLTVLHLLHDTFLARSARDGTERGRRYTEYVEEQGPPLVLFATFMALADWLRKTGRGGGEQRSWRGWPEEYRSPDSPEVRAF